MKGIGNGKEEALIRISFEIAQNMKGNIPMRLSCNNYKLTQLLNTKSDIRLGEVEIWQASYETSKWSWIRKKRTNNNQKLMTLRQGSSSRSVSHSFDLGTIEIVP